MGNASIRSKCCKSTEGSASTSTKDQQAKQPTRDSLRVRVEELEREVKLKDEELGAREQHIKALQEQLAKQTQVLSELSEELHAKSITLNMLQDAMRSEPSTGLAFRPASVRASGKSSPNLSVRTKDTPNRRKGAKSGVSAEPTSSSLQKFSFEKARVPKDAR